MKAGSEQGSERRGYSRRSFVKRSAGAAAAAGLGAAGGLPGTALAKPKPGGNPLLNAKPGPLASRKKMLAWNEYLAGLGARPTGGVSETQFRKDLKKAMQELGWETSMRSQTFTGWEAREYSLSVGAAGAAKEPVNVSYYYPYSGRTPKEGIAAELAYANRGTPADFMSGDFNGKIAVIDVPPFAIPIGAAFNTWDGSPPDINPTLPYDRAWVAAGPALAPAIAAGAVGAIIILSQSPPCANKQYSPFGKELQGIPALNVNAVVGERVRALAQAGGARAKLRLKAKQSPGKTKALLATLPGASDEVVVVNSHTDGTNLVEENGPLAMLSIAQQLSARPRSQRPVTYAFYFATGHFQYEVNSSAAYVTDYPDLFTRTKVGLTIEHLGCPEYLDNHVDEYVKTGQPEISGLFATSHSMATAAAPAMTQNGVSRCSVIQPVPKFFGEGRPLYEAGLPMLAYIAGPNYLLAETGKGKQLERFSIDRMMKETKAMAALLDQLATTSTFT